MGKISEERRASNRKAQRLWLEEHGDELAAARLVTSALLTVSSQPLRGSREAKATERERRLAKIASRLQACLTSPSDRNRLADMLGWGAKELEAITGVDKKKKRVGKK